MPTHDTRPTPQTDCAEVEHEDEPPRRAHSRALNIEHRTFNIERKRPWRFFLRCWTRLRRISAVASTFSVRCSMFEDPLRHALEAGVHQTGLPNLYSSSLLRRCRGRGRVRHRHSSCRPAATSCGRSPARRVGSSSVTRAHGALQFGGCKSGARTHWSDGELEYWSMDRRSRSSNPPVLHHSSTPGRGPLAWGLISRAATGCYCLQRTWTVPVLRPYGSALTVPIDPD